MAAHLTWLKDSVSAVGHGSLKCAGLPGTDISKSVPLIGHGNSVWWVFSKRSDLPTVTWVGKERRVWCVRQRDASQKSAPGSFFWEHAISYLSSSCRD